MFEKRKSIREKNKLIYSNGIVVDEFKWTKILASKQFVPYENVMSGTDFTVEFIQNNGLTRPILFEDEEGLRKTMLI